MKKGLMMRNLIFQTKVNSYFLATAKVDKIKKILNVSYIMVYHNQQNRKALLKKIKKVYTISTICIKKKIIGNGSLELE